MLNASKSLSMNQKNTLEYVVITSEECQKGKQIKQLRNEQKEDLGDKLPLRTGRQNWVRFYR